MTSVDRKDAATAVPLCLETLNTVEVAKLVAIHGLDEVTRRLFQSLQVSRRHGPAIKAIDRLCESPADCPSAGVQLAIVPGFLYREYPLSGADGKMLSKAAEKLGWDSQIIEVESTGRLATNASIILDWLARHGRRPTVLASISKGGADVVAALQRREAREAFGNVLGWVDVGGLILGSPVVDMVSRNKIKMLGFRALFAYRGWDIRAVLDLRRSGGILAKGFATIDTMRIVHAIGFPQEQDFVRAMLRNFSRQIGSMGPNDGSILLLDSIAADGVVYPVWGADHYMRPRYIMEPLCRGLLQYAAGLRPMEERT